jgi:hypothetical protein
MSLLDALAEIHDLANKGAHDWDLVAGTGAIAEARVGLAPRWHRDRFAAVRWFWPPDSLPVLRYGE